MARGTWCEGSGTWCVCATNVEIKLRSPILNDLANFPGTWDDLAKIQLARLIWYD